MTVTKSRFSRRSRAAEMRRVVVEQEDFDVGTETRKLQQSASDVGGIATFVGVVRDINDDDEISALYLEHYPGMTEKQISTIIEEASARWNVLGATVIHRVGQLYPADQIVFVGVASRHRGDAFDACEYIIDFLKTRATFWKKEQTFDGERWLETRQSDVETANAWKSDG